MEYAIFPPNPNMIPGPVRYHLLARTSPRYRHWRPFWELVITGVLFFVIQTVAVAAALMAAAIIEGAADGRTDLADSIIAGGVPDSPLGWGLTLFAMAVCFPAGLCAVNIAGRRRLGSLFSVTGRFRWPLMFRSMAITIIGIGLMYVVSSVAFDDVTIYLDESAAMLIGFALVLVPIQAATEEIIFRGVFAQAVGSWLRHPLFAIIVPTPFFVILHGYEVLGLLDVAVFALCAGFLAWATGGLEAPIGLHIGNNMIAFIGAALTGQNPGTPDLTVPLVAFSVCFTMAITAVMYFDKTFTSETTGFAEAIPVHIVPGPPMQTAMQPPYPQQQFPPQFPPQPGQNLPPGPPPPPMPNKRPQG